jgi:hypothetical protein
MGNYLSRTSPPSTQSATSPSPADDPVLRHSITQTMRLSKSKVLALLKANHMHYSIVQRNHFYNTLVHVPAQNPFLYRDLTAAYWCGVFTGSDATEII